MIKTTSAITLNRRKPAVDTKRLSEVFADLRNLLASSNSGRQWATGGRIREQAKSAVVPSQGYYYGVSGDEEIKMIAEESQLAALGLQNEPRLRRRNNFACSTHGEATGTRFELNQVLQTEQGIDWMRGRRCLLEQGAHVGRKVTLAHKEMDGLTYTVIRKSRHKRTIVANGATWVTLDREPDKYVTGYPIIIFE